MNVRGVLRTTRPLPRPVQFLGASVEHVAAMADKFLDDPSCIPGDKFEIYEERLVQTQTFKGLVPAAALVESTPVPGPTLFHAFVPGSGVHCDVCGGTHE